MSRISILLSSICFVISGSCFAEKVVWSGEVKADGTPSKVIPLTLNQPYQIKASGFVNLGKWVQNREELANDANYEFSKDRHYDKINALRNSHEIPIGDGSYHADHVYLSAPFVAKQSKMHFWVYDTNYDDNTGDFKVEIIELPKNPAK